MNGDWCIQVYYFNLSGRGWGGASHDISSAFNKPLFQGEDCCPWLEEK